MELPPWAQSDCFSLKLHTNLAEILREQLSDGHSGLGFPPKRIFVLSSRLSRVFDTEINTTAQQRIDDLTAGILSKHGKGLLPVSFLDHLDEAEDNSLYIICIHLNKDDLQFARVIRGCTNSIVIGWFWDNHHNYAFNAEISKYLHACIPAHYHGFEMLRHVNSATTYPMPLACSQWSAARILTLTDNYRSSKREYFLKARFSDWDASPQRKEIIDYYNRFFNSEFPEHHRILLSCTGPDDLEYFGMTQEEQFYDWHSAVTTLVLPVRSDLSSRFFDCLACECIPLVDKSIAIEALSDLNPGITKNIDYIQVDPMDPSGLKEAIEVALLLSTNERRRKGIRDYIIGSHMLENRIALIILSALSL